MKFLVDAQLPKSLSDWLNSRGVESLHTLDLPNGNNTTDNELIALADEGERILVSKDSDFLDSYILRGKPKQLLVISTGNIRNQTLIQHFENCFSRIIMGFGVSNYLELTNEEVIIHDS